MPLGSDRGDLQWAPTWYFWGLASLQPQLCFLEAGSHSLIHIPISGALFFSILTHWLCCVTLLGHQTVWVREICLSVPRCLGLSPVPVNLSQSVWGVEASSCSVLLKCLNNRNPPNRPCLVPIACISLKRYWKRKEVLRELFKAKKKSSAQEGWALAMTCFMSLRVLLHIKRSLQRLWKLVQKCWDKHRVLLSQILFHINDFTSQNQPLAEMLVLRLALLIPSFGLGSKQFCRICVFVDLC